MPEVVPDRMDFEEHDRMQSERLKKRVSILHTQVRQNRNPSKSIYCIKFRKFFLPQELFCN